MGRSPGVGRIKILERGCSGLRGCRNSHGDSEVPTKGYLALHALPGGCRHIIVETNDDIEAPPGVTLRDPEDMPAWRHAIFDGVKDSLDKSFPQSYGGVQLEVSNTHYVDPEHYDLAAQKHALLHDKYLSRRLKGTVTLKDATSGEPIEEKTLTLMRVPYLTERGTFIQNGNEHTSAQQLRLQPGVYTRKQSSGGLESHFNCKTGTGNAFRVGFEPETAQYKLKIQQANLHLYSLLHDLGIPDDKLEKSWGADILARNRQKYDSRVLDKAYERIVMKHNKTPTATKEDKARLVQEAWDSAKIDRGVAQHNLPSMFSMEKSSAWRKEGEEVEAKEKAMEFAPSLDHEDMVVTSEGTRWSALHHPYQNDDSWLKWYAGYCEGKRTKEDPYQKMRWKRFYRLNVDRFKDAPTVPRGLALQGWAIDPLSLLSGETLEAFKEKWPGHSKKASEEPLEVIPPEPRGLLFLEKAARYGAGVIFKMPNGKYLLEKNYKAKGMPEEAVGKLRPAGGGKSKRDANLRQTILREMEEEFGLDPKESADKIKLLGYIDDGGKFDSCAMFEMTDHDLKPGTYQASNSKDEKVVLVEADLDHPDYIGAHPKDLRKYSDKNYEGVDKSASQVPQTAAPGWDWKEGLLTDPDSLKLQRFSHDMKQFPESWKKDFNPQDFIDSYTQRGNEAMSVRPIGLNPINEIQVLRNAASITNPRFKWHGDIIAPPAEMLDGLPTDDPALKGYFQRDAAGKVTGVQDSALHYLSFQKSPESGYRQLWYEEDPKTFGKFNQYYTEAKSAKLPVSYKNLDHFIQLRDPEFHKYKQQIDARIGHNMRNTVPMYEAMADDMVKGDTLLRHKPQVQLPPDLKHLPAVAALLGAGALGAYLYHRHNKKEHDKEASAGSTLEDYLEFAGISKEAVYDLEKSAVIAEENGEFVLYTKDRSRVLGRHPSMAKAEAQERAIQISKHTQEKEAAHHLSPGADTLEQLIAAKAYSDAGDYTNKAVLMSHLLQKHGDEFEVTDDSTPHWGVTHVPSGFQIHVSRNIVPAKVHLRKEHDENDL